MIIKNKKILILSPHTDDGELGCGGSVPKLLEDGNEIHYVAFSTCQESVPKEYPEDILKKEVREATKVLGIKDSNLHIFDFPVRTFPEHRQSILDEMVKLQKNISPHIVFTPSSYDIHQDHLTIHEESLRAFKKVTILGYEFMWNNFGSDVTFFIKLNKNHIDTKIKALEKYVSQNLKSYMQKDYLVGHSMFRGIQVGAKYAEAFETIRIVF